MMPSTETTEEGVDSEDCFLQLHDGTPVLVHRARARDQAEIVAFVEGLSTESIELRFCGPARAETVTREVIGEADPEDRLSLLMETLEEMPHIVGNGEYVRYRQDPTRAEVAFLVADDYQGRGAGTLLLRELARHARSAGIRSFTAVVMAENVAMREVFLRAGFPYRVVCDGPVLLIELDIGVAIEPRTERFSTRIGTVLPTF
jgi:RimJ/RimL family protein N-acetyltransferase